MLFHMGALLAVDVANDRAKVVRGEALPSGMIDILEVREIDLGALSSSNGKSLESPGESDNTSPTFSAIDLEADTVIAFTSSQNVLTENLVLPFRDDKKLDQILPLQLQDLLPFSIDDFLIAHQIIDEVDSKYEILASLIPKSEVADILERLKASALEPKILTTRSSAISALAAYLQNEENNSFGIVLVSESACSLAICIEGKIKHLREMPFSKLAATEEQLDYILSCLLCSIAQVEIVSGASVARLFVLGMPSLSHHLKQALSCEIRDLDFSDLVNIDSSVDASASELAWAIGLFLSEKTDYKNYSRVNFRKNEFAYKPGWGNLLGAIKGEWNYIALFLVTGLLWCATTVYSSYAALSQVESEFTKSVQGIVPDLDVPNGGEIDFLKDKVRSVEQQLRSLSSLASLSPLESIKELSIAVDKTIDVHIDALNIRDSGFSFRGSVVDFPSLGKLNSALEKRVGRFCNVQVNSSSGTTSRESRVQFKAEVMFCK